MIVKEVVFTDESKVRIQHNGLVLKEYDSELEWYRFKIIADVAVVTADVSYDGGHYNGGPVVYGAPMTMKGIMFGRTSMKSPAISLISRYRLSRWMKISVSQKGRQLYLHL